MVIIRSRTQKVRRTVQMAREVEYGKMSSWSLRLPLFSKGKSLLVTLYIFCPVDSSPQFLEKDGDRTIFLPLPSPPRPSSLPCTYVPQARDSQATHTRIHEAHTRKHKHDVQTNVHTTHGHTGVETQSVRLPACRCVCQSVGMSVGHLSVCLFVSRYDCMSVAMSACRLGAR